MDITKFVVLGREQALLYGDYNTYRVQISGKLHSTRKKLGRTTKKGAKYTNKSTVTPQDIASSYENVHLLLLISERAWAHAMHMKSAHSTDTKGITGSTRSHIISRLHKASTVIGYLLESLEDRSVTGATDIDVLEARAYAASLSGAEQFERQNWEDCVKCYSITWVLYSALSTYTKNDIFKDLLSSTVEPSIRYGTYQMRIPRTVAIPVVARKYFPRTDTDLILAIEKLDPNFLRDTSKTKIELSESEGALRTITWRFRKVELEHASIAVALTSVASAVKKLTDILSSTSLERPKERAAAYDGVLDASQDAVDATKHAIDELVGEGISQGDKRMQSLQITKTAVSYDMVSWRIGRNRVLTGTMDGALPDSSLKSNPPRNKRAKRDSAVKEVGIRTKLSRLREKVALYDSTLQSLDAIKELPGVAADTTFLDELKATHHYFRTLKCLAIARSYNITSEHKNALALLFRASQLITSALPVLNSLPSPEASSPPSITISVSDAQSLADLVQDELQRHRALVELFDLTSVPPPPSAPPTSITPLVDRLNTYPPSGSVNLTNLVTYPPKIEPIPVKPLFLDVAWNYIDYPGRRVEDIPESESSMSDVRPGKGKEDMAPQQQQQQQQKKGWFRFGR